MIRNGNICFVPTSLAAPEICDREFISGLSVSSAPMTIREGGTYVQAYIEWQADWESSHKVEGLKIYQETTSAP